MTRRPVPKAPARSAARPKSQAAASAKSPPAPQPASSPLTLNRYVVAAAVALLTLAVYLPALGNGFVNWDDQQYVTSNPLIRSMNGEFFRRTFGDTFLGNWHPLTMISHALDYAVWGLNPFGHHLTSVVLHCIATFLVVGLVVRLIEIRGGHAAAGRMPAWLDERGAVMAAAVTGLLFGIHPLHVETVAWVAERKDVLCCLFYVGSIWCYLEHAARTEAQALSIRALLSARYLAAVALFLLALMSKPMAVTLPAVVLLVAWYPLDRLRTAKMRRNVLIEVLPFAAMSLAICVLTFVAQKGTGAMGAIPPPTGVRVFVALYACAAYLLAMVAPLRLSPFYPYPMDVSPQLAQYGIPVLVFLLASGVCLAQIRRTPVVAAAWAFYVVTLAPVTGLVAQVGTQLIADRYTYLPSLGPFLMAGLGTAWLRSRVGTNHAALAITAAAAALLLSYGYLAVRQIGVWKDGVTLWSRVIAMEPERAPAAYVNRGVAWVNEQQRIDKALPDFERAIALEPVVQTIFVNRVFLQDAYRNRELALQELRGGASAPAGADPQLAHAIEVQRQEVERNPASVEALISLGVLYGSSGSLEKGIEQFDNAIAVRPDSALAYGNRAHAFVLLGRYEQALQDLDKAIELDPDYAGAFLKRAGVLAKLGQGDRGRADLTMACDLGSREACDLLAGRTSPPSAQ